MIAAILQGSVPLFINWIILGGDLQGYRNVVLIVPPGDIKNRKGCMCLVLHTCREWNYNLMLLSLYLYTLKKAQASKWIALNVGRAYDSQIFNGIWNF